MSTIRLQSSDRGTSPAEAADRYCFRFELDPDREPSPSGISELLTRHLRELLDLLEPTSGGQTVRIDGCRLLNGAEEPLRPRAGSASKPKDLLSVYEPRLSYLRSVIESLLQVVRFESGGEPVEVDGFRLRRPEQWLSRSGSALDVLAHAATRCNLGCRFCYNNGSPDLFKAPPRPVEEEYREILTRIHYYQPAQKMGIFPNAGSLCEALLHPNLPQILTALREKSAELFRIPTNGSLLTEKKVAALSSFQPVFVDVSLNSASPRRRQWLMRDPRPEVAIASLARLKKAGISYSVVIVPWPFPSISDMLEDLAATVAFADRHDPAFIQISFPGYSRFFEKDELFDHEEVWESLKETIRRLRRETSAPIVMRPGLFEEYAEPERAADTRPVGVIKNSPAARGGIIPGDRLLKIGGLPVKDRSQARSLLSLLAQSEVDSIGLTVEREGARLDLTLKPSEFGYPYAPESSPLLGIVFASAGVPASLVERLTEVVYRHGAREVLLLTSHLVKPSLERHLDRFFPSGNVKLHLRVPQNHYLGGNIFMGDLLTVSDFAQEIDEFLCSGAPRPDLIVLPSSPFHLSGWGRDLTGEVYLELERRFDIPVALIQCNPISD